MSAGTGSPRTSPVRAGDELLEGFPDSEAEPVREDRASDRVGDRRRGRRRANDRTSLSVMIDAAIEPCVEF
jgi:hypothetical protein